MKFYRTILFLNLTIAANFLFSATYTVTSKTDTVEAGVYGGNVINGIYDAYGITAGIPNSVSVSITRNTSGTTSGVFFDGGTSTISGIGSILIPTINVTNTLGSNLYGVRFANAKMAAGSKLNTNVIAKGYENTYGIYETGTTQTVELSGTYKVESINETAYGIGLYTQAIMGTLNNLDIVAKGKNAYGIYSNRSSTGTATMNNGCDISLNGTTNNYIIYSVKGFTINGDSNVNTFSTTANSMTLYSGTGGATFASGKYKFEDTTHFTSSNASVSFGANSKMIIASNEDNFIFTQTSLKGSDFFFVKN